MAPERMINDRSGEATPSSSAHRARSSRLLTRSPPSRECHSCPRCSSTLGGRFKVSSRVERACDAVSRVRHGTNTVFLDDLRCGGEGHGGCQAGCRLYWKERWLRRADVVSPVETFVRDDAFERLRTLASAELAVTSGASTPMEIIHRCQATEFIAASELIAWRDWRSFAREVTSRNVSIWRFLRVAFGILVNERRRRKRGGYPFQRPAGSTSAAPEPRGLTAGTPVRIRPAKEIEGTLDAKCTLRGLSFDREMTPYCGSETTVKVRVERLTSTE